MLQVIIPPSIFDGFGDVVVFEKDGCLFHTSFKEDESCYRIPNLILEEYLQGLLNAYKTYLSLRMQGIKAEDARFVLPNATKTEVYTTFNLRQWGHFFEMRLDKHAQWEIRLLARWVYDYFKEHIPVIVEGLKTHSGEEIG
jgi:thymidylate synthase (FAD)